MGGGAFLQARADDVETRPNTPRMSPDIYRKLKKATLDTLRKYYPGAEVRALIEAPEKVDYGDLDICIAQEEQIDFTQLANHLGAAGLLIHNAAKATLAIDRDGNCEDCKCVIYRHGYDKSPDAALPPSTAEYAQLDIEVLSPNILGWHTFYSSYGDLAGLLGRIVNPLGFTVSNRGMELRLEELDLSKTDDYVCAEVADPHGRVLLSNDPKKIIEFLGCSILDYEAGFNTVEALYSWLVACRLLTAAALTAKRSNSHERRKQNKRTVYGGFFTEWLPANRPMLFATDEEDQAAALQQLRKKFTQQAVGFFRKWDDYETKQQALTIALRNGLAVKLLKPSISELAGVYGSGDNGKKEVMQGLRRYVIVTENGEPTIGPTKHSDEHSELHKLLDDKHAALRDLDMVHGWIRDNWMALKTHGKKRDHLTDTGDA